MHHDPGVIEPVGLMRRPGVVDRVRTGKRPGKCRVKVDDHPGKTIEEGRREQVHPAGLHDQVGAGVGDLRRQRSVVVFAGSARIVGDGLRNGPIGRYTDGTPAAAAGPPRTQSDG